LRTAVGKGEDGKVCRPIIVRSFLSSPTSNESHVLNTYWIMPRFGSMERYKTLLTYGGLRIGIHQLRTAVGKGEDGKVCRPIIARSFLFSPTSNESHVLNTYWIMPRFGSMERYKTLLSYACLRIGIHQSRTAVGKGEDGEVCRPIIGRSFLSSPTSNESHALNTYWIMPRFGSMER